MTEPDRPAQPGVHAKPGVHAQPISPADETRRAGAAHCLHPLQYNLAVTAVLRGTVPGAVYADDATAPRWALLHTGHRCYLAGDAANGAGDAALAALLRDLSAPAAQGRGAAPCLLYFQPPAWQPLLATWLAAREPLLTRRAYYVWQRPRFDGQVLLPDGVTLQPVTRALVESHLENVTALREEMASESPSVDAFLARCFGFCAVAGQAIVGWCLSEYNQPGRCEVGIATIPAFRRQGIATALAGALVAHALAQGITTIGWHCFAGNEPSVATAEKAGFVRQREYDAYFLRGDQP